MRELLMQALEASMKNQGSEWVEYYKPIEGYESFISGGIGYA